MLAVLNLIALRVLLPLKLKLDMRRQGGTRPPDLD
jgi:hypothetical protein